MVKVDKSPSRSGQGTVTIRNHFTTTLLTQISLLLLQLQLLWLSIQQSGDIDFYNP